MPERGGLYFPIKLRCAGVSALLDTPELPDAIARALGRSFAKARASLPAECASGDGVVLNPAWFCGETSLSADEQKAILSAVERAIGQAAAAQSVSLAAPPGTRGTSRGEELSEPYDPARFGITGYRMPAYDGGKKMVPVKRKNNPFLHLQSLFDPTMLALDDLYLVALDQGRPNDARKYSLLKLEGLRNFLSEEAFTVDLLARLWTGEVGRDALTEKEKKILEDADELSDYFKDGKPNPKGIADFIGHLKHLMVLAALIRGRLVELRNRVAGFAGADPIGLRQTVMDIGSYYLDLVLVDDDEAAVQIAFLDSYYSSPNRIGQHAALRWIKRMFVDDIKPNLPGAAQTTVDLIDLPQAYNILFQHAGAVENSLWGEGGSESGPEIFGDLPRSQDQLGQIPDALTVSRLSRTVLQMQIETPVLFMWTEADRLLGRIVGMRGSGDWHDDLWAIIREFQAELRKSDHQAFVTTNAEALSKRLTDVRDDIYATIRRRAIIIMLVETAFLMILGGGIAVSVGTWVLRVTEGSRFLALLAEGAAITIFNAVAMPSQRPTSVGGWIFQFGENVLMIRLGQFVGALAKAGSVAGKAASIRRVILTVSGVLAANVAIQTAVQLLDAKVKGLSGESSFTEMLGMNLALNVIGAIFGGAVNSKNPRMDEQAFARLPEGDQLLELKTSWKINEDTARRWIDLRNRSLKLQESFGRIGKAAQQRKISPDEFEAWRKEALDLAKDLSGNLDLVEIMGSGRTRQEVAAMVDQMTTALEGLQYSDVVRPLPELTEGLTGIGEGPTYTYDPATVPAKRIKALRDFFEPEMQVVELPGGGWEARAKDGRIAFQLLSLERATQRRFPRSLDTVAQGPKATAGLARVRTQGFVPELEAQLAEAAQRNPDSVVDLLQILSRGHEITDGKIWRGLSNYLKHGNPKTLVRAISLTGDTTGMSAVVTLYNMADWGPLEIEGLEAIYNVRPDTTGPQINVFLRDLGPDGVRETLRDIAELAPVSGPRGLKEVVANLFTPFYQPQDYTPGRTLISPAQRGAIGTIFAGLKVHERYPGLRLEFESVDVTPGGTIRKEDIALFSPSSGVRLLGFEIKEVTSAFLGDRAPRELAADIALDYRRRTDMQAATGTPVAPFRTFRWLVRRWEVQDLATESLKNEGVTNITPDKVDARMRDLLRKSLEDAFKRQDFLNLPGPVQAEYIQIFQQSLSFLEFF